jgi:hypothetical protein
MPEIDLGKAMEQAAADGFWAIRGKAIQAYASLEQSLCLVFCVAADLKRDVAGVIFFKVSPTARNPILEDILKKKFGSQFNLFWNSIFVELQKIDRKRNEIVHWNAINNIGLDAAGQMKTEITLRPPKTWGVDPTGPLISANDLLDFMAKCDVYARACNMFFAAMQADEGGNFAIPVSARQPWLEIFQRPLIYPLPDSHLLSPNYKGLGIPLPPSEA